MNPTYASPADVAAFRLASPSERFEILFGTTPEALAADGINSQQYLSDHMAEVLADPRRAALMGSVAPAAPVAQPVQQPAARRTSRVPLLVGALVVAVGVLAVTGVAVSRRGGTAVVTVLGPGPLTPLGTCYTGAADHTTFARVDCAQPHRDETVGLAQVSGSTYPASWGALIASGCASNVQRWTRLTPDALPGGLSATGLYPTLASWNGGDHSIICLVEYATPMVGSALNLGSRSSQQGS